MIRCPRIREIFALVERISKLSIRSLSYYTKESIVSRESRMDLECTNSQSGLFDWKIIHFFQFVLSDAFHGP